MINEERDRLRRIAYGPDATAKERVAAEAGLRRLEEQERASLVAASAAEASAHHTPDQASAVHDERDDEENSSEGEASDDEVTGAPLWLRRINIGWLIPIVVGSLLVGAVGAWGFHLAGATNPSGGDLRAADAWFDLPAADEATAPWYLAQTYGVEVSNIRLSNAPGVWFGRTKTSFCLLVMQWEASGAGCVKRPAFAKSGITLAVGSYIFRWRGKDVSVVQTTATGEVNVPILPPPASGPGNVEAANALFSLPPPVEEPFPAPWIMGSMGVDKNDVRKMGENDSGLSVWAMKQGDSGFCLVVFDATHGGTQYVQCATLEEFAASGLVIHSLTFKARWDGESMSFTG